MESVDQQLRRQKENYEHMTEDELCDLAEDAYDLTEIAREALQAVITERGFTVRLKLEPPALLRAEPPEDDEGLIDFQWPDNADHAWRWMKCLTAAGIPSFLGPDNVMHLEEFQGKFDGPVGLKIRGVDRDRAYDAVARAKAHANDGNEKKEPTEEKENVDQQLRALKENYEHMTEGKLYALAEKAYELTEISRKALQAVIAKKNLAVRLKLHPLEFQWPEDEDLVIFRREPNMEEAGWTMKVLDAAWIPSFLCLEVRANDLKRAHAAFERAIDDEFKENDPEEKKEFAILCPKCHSAKAVLEGACIDSAKPPATDKFQWHCDACGHQWVDDGITQEILGGQSWPGEEFPSRDKKSSQ